MSIVEDLKFIANASRVVRWHTASVLHRETLGEHHGMVAQLLLLIFPDCSKEALAYAVTHDVGELITGDIPSPTKDALDIREAVADLENSEENPFHTLSLEISEIDYNQVLVCDILARVMYLWLERRMGSVHLMHKLHNAMHQFDKLIENHFPEEAALFKRLFEELFIDDGLTY